MKKAILLLLLLPVVAFGQLISKSAPATADVNLYGYAYKDSVNTFSTRQIFSATDSSIIVKGIKGYTGQSSLGLFSPGDRKQGALFYNSTTANQIYFYTSGGGGMFTLTNNDMFFGDGTTGRPSITEDSPTTSAVSYTFVGDKNSGLLWNSADNISLVTGGTSRIAVSASAVTVTLPLIVSGTSSYILFPTMTKTQRDALTPVQGMVVFNTTTSELQLYDGSTWVRLN